MECGRRDKRLLLFQAYTWYSPRAGNLILVRSSTVEWESTTLVKISILIYMGHVYVFYAAGAVGRVDCRTMSTRTVTRRQLSTSQDDRCLRLRSRPSRVFLTIRKIEARSIALMYTALLSIPSIPKSPSISVSAFIRFHAADQRLTCFQNTFRFPCHPPLRI
jgi:hypothetical protein